MNKLSNLRFSMMSFLLILFLSFGVTKAQDWEMLWSYDISTSAGEGQAGSETDGMYLYTAFWDSGNFAKFDLDGNWIETFSIPGVENIKDLAFDGEFFYGSNAERNEPIFIMDFSSQSLMGNIPVVDSRIRHIAYDSNLDQFWCGNWQSDIICVNRSGEITSTIPFATHRMIGIYGSAYDNVSEGGPYLWLHSQSCFGSVDGIAQINLASGTPTGIWHDVISDAGSEVENAAAGGLFNSVDILPGYFVLGGIVQGTPNKIFAYSLMQYGMIPPELTSPENAAFEVDVLPLFQWTAAAGAVSYNIQVSLFSNFSETIIDVNGISGLTYQATTSLEETTRYFWRVRGLNAGGEFTAWSKKYSFITEGELPQPTLLTPLNEAGGVIPAALFTWTRHIAATNYYLQVSSSEDFTDLIIDEPMLTSNRFTGSGLGMNTQYWWRVQMLNPFGNSDWSEEWTFTTGSFFFVGTGTEYNDQWTFPSGYANWYGGVKQQFLIRAEELYAGGASPGFLTSLGFNVAVINVGIPLEDYEIQLKLTYATELGEDWELDGFTSVYFNDSYTPVLDWNVHEFTTPFFWDGASNLLVDVCFNNMSYTYNESCYWTMCDYTATHYFNNDFNETVCTEVQWTNTTNYRPNMQFSLELAALIPPVLDLPASNTVCITTTPLFEWIDVEGATSYSIQVAEDPDFYNIIIEESGVINSEYQVPATTPLNELTKYYWRVNATDDINTSFWSQKWNFITDGDLIAPTLTSPFNGAGDLNPFVTLMWENLVGSQQYQIQVAADEEFETIIYELTTTSNQIMISGLELNTQYFWRVLAENECSESPFSEVWSFTIGNIPFVYGYNNWWMDEMMPGPVMFSLADPGNMFSIAEQQDMDNIYSGTWAEGVWYGVTPWAQEFLTINTTNGDRTIIGNTGVQIHGISYDVQSGTMFGVSYNDGVSQLYTIDMATGASTLIGPIGNLEINNLGCSVDGDLYTVNTRDDSFYYIDKFTGNPTRIGPLGFNAEDNQDLEFDNVNNICYWSGYVDWTGYLLTIDIETGAATQVGMFPNGLSLTALAIPFTPACLDFPGLVAPENQSVCNVLLPSFDWNDVEGALNYTFQLATSRAFDNVLYSEEGILTTELTLPASVALDNQTRYYWRVQAFGDDDCNSYWSSKWSFVTEGELPQTILIEPANAAVDCMISPLFSWVANAGAANYHIQIAIDEEFSDIIIDEPYITTSYYSGAELSTNTQYWWKVMMSSDCSEGEWSEIRTFTTGSSIAIGNGTNTDSWIGPYNLADGGSMYQYLILANEMTAAGGISGALNSLSFNIASLNSDAAAQDFTIRLKHTTENNLMGMWDLVDFTTVYGPTDYTPVLGWNTHYFDNIFVWDGVSNILVDICFNNVDETYNGPTVFATQTPDLYFRMHSEYGNPDLCGSDEINWWSGTNLRPNMRIGVDLSGFFPPVLNSPEYGSLCNSIIPIFDWENVENAISYTIQIATNPNFDVPIYENSEIIESEFQLPETVELNYNERYYWRVNAFNGDITSFWSKTFNFITEGEYLPIPTLINPENGVENFLTAFEFLWTGSIAASGYHLQVATDEGFENLYINELNVPQTSYIVSGLPLNTQFFWRVMMVNPCSENEWSEVRTFTTGSFFIAGTGTQFNGQWDYPAAYGNSSPGAKQQYLILAEELINSGITAGTLTSIAFNVAVIRSGNALQDYTISMKNTTTSEFNWEDPWELTGWNLVYGPVDYTPELGWNTHPFDNNFVWDGVSNIIVDVCYNNYNMSSNNEGTYWTQTDFNSSKYYGQWEDDVLCTDPQWTNTWNWRPNMAFGVDPGGIQPPRLVAPLNNAYNVSTTPLFDWMVVEEATSYTLQVSTNPEFSSLEFEQVVPDATSYQVPAGSELDEATLYYWRVNSTDDENISNWSNSWRFATLTPTPTLVSPLNGATGVSLLTPFDWNDVLTNLSYNIQVAEDIEFNRLVVDEIVTTSDFSYGFYYNTTLHWRVRVFSNGVISNWSEVWTFTTQIEIPWEYDETDIFANIIVPANINPMIGDRPIAMGDAIGVFYQREPGEWYCGGFGVWMGDNLGIIVWGDNPETPIKEGFATNEPFTFKVWDAVLAQEWNAIATYQVGNDYFVPNGFSMLASLIVYIPDNMNLYLSSGWNIVSSYISPENPDIEVMFAPIVNNVNLLKNENGDMYIPAFEINTIGNWVSTSGYLANIFNDDMISITGAKLVPENTPINLNNGWNLTAYIRDNEMAPISSLASINNYLTLAKNNVGGLYIPAYGINTIGLMQPGQGYYLYMSEDAILTYPANSAQKNDLNVITPNSQNLIPSFKNTGNNATLLLSIPNNDGNEIGVYNENNELIGSGIVLNGIAAITIWGDDIYTPINDGAKDNEFLSVKLYNTSNNTLKDISLSDINEITSNSNNKAFTFKTNAIYFAKASTNDELIYGMSIKNIPNPASSSTLFEFSLPEEGTAEIKIYSSTGELVASFARNHYLAGLQKAYFDVSNLANGVYNVILCFGENKISSLMIVGK